MYGPEADRLTHLAAEAIAAAQFSQAQVLLDIVLRADPNHTPALCQRAEIALFHKDHTQALALTDRVLRLEASFAPAWTVRGRACWLAGRPLDAVSAVSRAVAIQPADPASRIALAQYLAWTGQHEAGRAVLEPLLRRSTANSGAYAAALAMLGECAIAEGRFEEADPLLAQALGLEPRLVASRMLRGTNLLRLGRYQEGWPDYAILDRIPALNPLAAEGPAWRGGALAGARILVTDDQGHGDAIQYFRYVAALRSLNPASITWRTFPPLVRLFAGAAPGIDVVGALSPGASFDLHCTSTALPRLLGTAVETIPAPVRYLQPPENPRSDPSLPSARRRVGLAWSGDRRHARDHLRSIPAEAFLTLTAPPGISFHSLQHDVRPDDMAAVGTCGGLAREVENTADFAETAALIDRLDLVITVDTAIAHLAAALGKPVWILLHVAPDWRWMAERADSPWYPTARLFRVRREEWPGGADAGWGPMLDRVGRALRQWAAG